MHPSVPRPVRIVLVLATIASLLAIPSLASAAPKGSKLTVVVNALTPQVSPGRDGAFDVVVTNGGNATLTHAVLTVGAGAVKSKPASCSADLVCDLGTLVAGDVRTLRFVVGPLSASTTVTADLQVDAGTGNPSQDAKPAQGTILVNENDAFFGAWHGAGDALTGGISNGHQTASAHVPDVGFDYPAAMSESNGRFCGQRGVGSDVNLTFADGGPVTPYITLTVTYDAEARGNRTPGNVGFVHLDDDEECHFLVKGCDTVGCFNASWVGTGPDKLLQIVALLPSNGIVKGF